MNLIDLLLILVVFLSVWSAVQRGFILSAFDLASWFGSILLAFVTYKPVSLLFDRLIPSLGVWAVPIAFIVLVAIFRILLDAIVVNLLSKIPLSTHRNIINRILGVIPGVFIGLLWAALLATILMLLPFANKIGEKAQQSPFASNLVEKVQWAESKLSPVFGEALKHGALKMTGEVGTGETVKLPYRVEHPIPRPDLEAEMLKMVNQERTSRGLHALKADPELTVVARAHSVDMFARGYFSHYTPEKKDPFDRMNAAHVHFLIAGENLAFAHTLSIAHTGLMNSPGHRANILNPSYGRVGIGIVDGGIYGLMISQDFRN